MHVSTPDNDDLEAEFMHEQKGKLKQIYDLLFRVYSGRVMTAIELQNAEYTKGRKCIVRLYSFPTLRFYLQVFERGGSVNTCNELPFYT